MRPGHAFTWIEPLIVIGILAVFAVVLLPQELDSNRMTNCRCDALQLRMHVNWLELYRLKHNGAFPAEGGSKFVLATRDVIAHTPENFDKYFVPGVRDHDPIYREKRAQLEKGRDPWPDLARCTSADTHYAGRMKQHVHDADHAGEALMADDNEGGWTHRDGTVNLLLGDGNVRTMSYRSLRQRYGLGPFEADKPIATCGPESPIPECRKLAY